MQVEEVDMDMGALVGEGPRVAKEFLLTMYYPDLVREGGACMRYPVTQAICKMDEFWQEKLARDFGIMKGTAEAVRRGTTTWRREYDRAFRDMERAELLKEMNTEVSSTPPPFPTSRQGRELNKLTRRELMQILKLYNINYVSRDRKAQLIEKLQENVPEDELRSHLTRM